MFIKKIPFSASSGLFEFRYKCFGLSTAKNKPMCASKGTKKNPARTGHKSSVPSTSFNP